MITTVLCYSATSGIAVADCGKPCRVDMGNVGQRHSLSSGDRLLKWANETAELFCDGEETYTDVWIDGHRETVNDQELGTGRSRNNQDL